MTMLKSKDIKLSDIYESYIVTPSGLSSIALSLGDSDTTVTVSSADIMNVFSNYLSWLMPYHYSDSGTEPTDLQSFISKWSAFTTRKKRSYDRVAIALYTDYSPIDNYDKHSDITTKNPEITTTNVIASRTDSDVIASRTDSDVIATKTVHNKETAYNNLTANEDSQTVADGFTDSYTRGGGTDSHTRGGGTDTSSVNAHNVEVIEYTHGNIGVEKSSNIAREEIIFRIGYDLANIIVSDFITEYCYLV